MKPVLVITKPTELTQSGNVVLGQCEPYTGGWQLLIWKGKASPINLVMGTYEELRALQVEWDGLDEDEIVERAKKVTDTRTSAVSSTVAMAPLSLDDSEATQIMDHDTVREAVERLGEEEEEGFHLKSLQTTAGVMVLRVLPKREEGSTPALSFGREISEELRGVVLSLEDAAGAEPAAVMGLVSLLVGRLGLGGRFVWVVAGEKFADIVERSGLNEVIRVFPTVEEALKELH